MGAEITKESTSKYILNEKNFNRIARETLEFSGIDKDEIVMKKIKVGSYVNKNGEEEDINKHTIIVGMDKSKKINE